MYVLSPFVTPQQPDVSAKSAKYPTLEIAYQYLVLWEQLGNKGKLIHFEKGDVFEFDFHNVHRVFIAKLSCSM